ncbi:DUF6414 family protein [Jiangella alba]|uniref:Uncharacterized protein n=1 Tax=Jiangella alba TaxID=561176 RepID=A0A1H5MZ79_9ACTN|nr:hypothetical protein [Jiangella alba]SEE94037.1 hypothetical protein SAMN04488561_3518 [Jiangella alba]
MNRLKQWWRGRKAKDEEAPAPEPWYEMREFVYLDEVSVVSLLSSREGKVPSEFTDTSTNSSRAQLSANIGANAGFAKSEIGSQLESSATEDTKVVSRATIQAIFKRLYDGELARDHLAIAPIRDNDKKPTSSDSEAMLSEPSRAGVAPWTINVASLRRGQMVELEVELYADPAFRVSTIASSFAEMVKDSKELIGQLMERHELDQALEINALIEKLMAGLVPLRCRVANYVLVGEDDNAALVHREVVKKVPENERRATVDVQLVGVTEKSLYWKDTRRVLFAKDRFRVLCRLNEDGIGSAWRPVTLVDVLGEVAPDFGEVLGIFGPDALQQMADRSARQSRLIEPRVAALRNFGELMALEMDVKLTDEDLEQIDLFASEGAELFKSVHDSRPAFRAITEYIKDRSSVPFNPVAAAKLRAAAAQRQGLHPGGTAMDASATTLATKLTRETEYFLNAEIIAIYW